MQGGGVDAACLSQWKRGGWKRPCSTYGHPNHCLGVYKHFDATKQGVSLSPLHSCHPSPSAEIPGTGCQRTHSASYTREAQKQTCSRRKGRQIRNTSSATRSLPALNSLQVRLWSRLTLKGTERCWQIWGEQDPSGCTHSTKLDGWGPQVIAVIT